MPTQGAWGSKFHVLSSLWWGIYNLRKAKEIRKLRLVLTFSPIYTFFFFQVSRETELCSLTLSCMLWSAIKLAESATSTTLFVLGEKEKFRLSGS